MIYLIKTEYKNCTLLKIGYTGDNNSENRFLQYKMHNPLCEVKYTISGGTEEDEKNIHRFFRKYMYQDYGKEWFYENQEIYDFFENNKTLESLQLNLPKRKIQQDYKKLKKTITKVVNRWLCLISKSIKDLNNNYNNYNKFILECRNEVGNSIFVEDDVLEYLSIKYNISEDIQNQIKDFLCGLLDNSEKISNSLKEFNKCKDFPMRMKMLCETDLTEQELEILLDQIPISYKNYYETLGPDRCKALGYNKTYISKEYSDLQIDISKLKIEVYKNFKINSKYSKSYAKEMISSIYSSLGYNKTPKASDLEEYFEIKECKLLNQETGKREHGFEIIKKKKERKFSFPPFLPLLEPF